MIPEYYAIVGAAVASLGGLYYLLETIKGKSQPNRVTWLLWGILPMIIFVAQRVQGVKGLSWFSLAVGVMPLLVLAASFTNKKAYWRTSRLDVGLMVAALIGMVAWALTKDPNLAIGFTLIADFFAGAPTLIKAYYHPETESWIAYAISSLGAGITLLAIQRFDFQSSAFVILLLLANGSLALLCLRKPRLIPASA